MCDNDGPAMIDYGYGAVPASSGAAQSRSESAHGQAEGNQEYDDIEYRKKMQA